MLKQRLLILGIVIGLSFQVSLQAQTYATPELKQKVEAEEATYLQKIRKDSEVEVYRYQGEIPDQFLSVHYAERPASITYAAPVDVKRPDLYKLAAVDAVDIANKHTSQEMMTFQTEAEGVLTYMNIVLDWEGGNWYYIPRDNQEKPLEKKFRVAGNLLQFLECQECQDNTFTIVEHKEDALILQLQPQDEGRFFVYSLTFLK